MNNYLAENINTSTEELYLKLTNQLLELHMIQLLTPIDNKEKIQQGKIWFNNFLKNSNIKKKICNSDLYSEKSKLADSTAAIADIILSQFNVESPINFSLALLLTRFGLEKYCSNEISTI